MMSRRSDGIGPWLDRECSCAGDARAFSIWAMIATDSTANVVVLPMVLSKAHRGVRDVDEREKKRNEALQLVPVPLAEAIPRSSDGSRAEPQLPRASGRGGPSSKPTCTNASTSDEAAAHCSSRFVMPSHQLSAQHRYPRHCCLTPRTVRPCTYRECREAIHWLVGTLGHRDCSSRPHRPLLLSPHHPAIAIGVFQRGL